MSWLWQRFNVLWSIATQVQLVLSYDLCWLRPKLHHLSSVVLSCMFDHEVSSAHRHLNLKDCSSGHLDYLTRTKFSDGLFTFQQLWMLFGGIININIHTYRLLRYDCINHTFKKYGWCIITMVMYFCCTQTETFVSSSWYEVTYIASGKTKM